MSFGKQFKKFAGQNRAVTGHDVQSVDRQHFAQPATSTNASSMNC